jgi:uncharacterized protein YjbJ (UPF0337 family)
MGAGSSQQPSGTAASPSTTTPRTGAAPQTGTQTGKDENNAHWRRLSEDWKSHAGEVRKEWPQLTEADVNAINGRRSELVSRLQTRYRISPAEADRQVSRFEQRQR